MPSLGLSLGLGGVRVLGASLNFAALTALPEERRAAVTAAANEAATTLDVDPQSVIDAAGRCLEWWDWRSNTFTDAAATVPAVQGNAIETFRGVAKGLLASQANAALKPVLGAGGIVSTSDLLSGTATGFPTGDANLGVVSVVDFAASQPSSFPVPFARAVTNNATRLLIFATTVLNAAVGSNPITFPSTANPLGRAVGSYCFYTTSPRSMSLRSDDTGELVESVGSAPTFSGPVHIGGLPEASNTLSSCTIRQVAFTTSIADARILYPFLRALEGI